MKGLLIVWLLGVTSTAALAHQPVVDMAPRWNGGYGFQTRVEHANSDTITWLEGVYTFKPALRMTLKIPYGGDGLGNSIFAVPLKKYKNAARYTSNWGLTPSVRAPTGGGNDWDGGLSLSYSSESVDVYQLYDLHFLGDRRGLDINVGTVHADGQGSAWFTLWDVTAVDSDSGQRILTGPVLVYFRRNIAARLEYKLAAYDDDDEWSGNYLSFTLGIVY
jgi:hypothetical protein